MKMCQQCGRRPATVEFIQVIGNVRRETYLCHECAVEQSLEGSIETLRAFVQQMMEELLLQAEEHEGRLDIPEKPCRICGTTFREFLESGLLGCPTCYDEFHEALKPVLRRLHGATRMKATAGEASTKPINAQNIEPEIQTSNHKRAQLEAELQKAIEDENYEHAAQIRDTLKQIE